MPVNSSRHNDKILTIPVVKPDTCSGFGSTATVIIIILGVVILLLVYIVCLLLCLPRCRKKRAKSLDVSRTPAECTLIKVEEVDVEGQCNSVKIPNDTECDAEEQTDELTRDVGKHDTPATSPGTTILCRIENESTDHVEEISKEPTADQVVHFDGGQEKQQRQVTFSPCQQECKGIELVPQMELPPFDNEIDSYRNNTYEEEEEQGINTSSCESEDDHDSVEDTPIVVSNIERREKLDQDEPPLISNASPGNNEESIQSMVEYESEQVIDQNQDLNGCVYDQNGLSATSDDEDNLSSVPTATVIDQSVVPMEPSDITHDDINESLDAQKNGEIASPSVTFRTSENDDVAFSGPLDTVKNSDNEPGVQDDEEVSDEITTNVPCGAEDHDDDDDDIMLGSPYVKPSTVVTTTGLPIVCDDQVNHNDFVEIDNENDDNLANLNSCPTSAPYPPMTTEVKALPNDPICNDILTLDNRFNDNSPNDSVNRVYADVHSNPDYVNYDNGNLMYDGMYPYDLLYQHSQYDPSLNLESDVLGTDV